MMLTLARNHQNRFVALKFEASQKYLLHCVSDFNKMFVFRVAFEEERLFTSDEVTQRCFMLGKEIKARGDTYRLRFASRAPGGRCLLYKNR